MHEEGIVWDLGSVSLPCRVRVGVATDAAEAKAELELDTSRWRSRYPCRTHQTWAGARSGWRRRGKWEGAGRALCPRRLCCEEVPTLGEDHGNEETL